MDLSDYKTARHESAHAAAGVVTGRKVASVKRYGQHGILRGHGITEFEDDPEPGREDVYRALICTAAGPIWEPTGGVGDLEVLQKFRDEGFEVDLVLRLARAMVEEPEFRRVARAIETALMQQPWLSGADVERLLA